MLKWKAYPASEASGFCRESVFSHIMDLKDYFF